MSSSGSVGATARLGVESSSREADRMERDWLIGDRLGACIHDYLPTNKFSDYYTCCSQEVMLKDTSRVERKTDWPPHCRWAMKPPEPERESEALDEGDDGRSAEALPRYGCPLGPPHPLHVKWVRPFVHVRVRAPGGNQAIGQATKLVKQLNKQWDKTWRKKCLGKHQISWSELLFPLVLVCNASLACLVLPSLPMTM